MTDWQLANRGMVREAMDAVAAQHRPVVLWTVAGGNVAGFASFTRLRHTTASERLKAGLGELADHYRLPGAEGV
jgi:hypothetical protein